MLRINVLRVHDEQLPTLRAWMEELNARADEVRETFVNEGTRHEQAHLVQTSDGPLLVYAVETEDVDASVAAYRASTLPIDLQHREVMSSVVAEVLPTELLLDMTVT